MLRNTFAIRQAYVPQNLVLPGDLGGFSPWPPDNSFGFTLALSNNVRKSHGLSLLLARLTLPLGSMERDLMGPVGAGVAPQSTSSK